MDKANYDYHELIPGVFVQYSKGATPHTDILVASFLLPLIIKLRKARPKWDFVHTNNVYAGNELYRFNIEENGEQLGALWRTTNYRTNVSIYSYDCPSLKARRRRGHETNTGDINRACKEILREFKPKSLQDIIAEQYSLTNTKITNSCNRAHSRFTTDRSNLANSFYTFAKTQWDAYRRSFVPSTQEAGAMADIHSDEANYCTLDNILNGWSNGAARMVYINHGEHYVLTSKGDAPVKLEEADFTPLFKKQMGVLKLLEVDGFYPDVGMRIAEDTFLVVMEKPGT